MSGLTPDLEALAVRIFGEEPAAERKRALELARAFGDPEPPSLADRLERLTVALATLRERLRPDATPFEERMEEFARGAGKAVRFPLRGDLEDEAPGVLLDPRLWLHVHAARRAALYGEKRAAKALEVFLEALAIPKRRKLRARREVAERLRESAKAQAKVFREHPGVAGALPDFLAAVESVRGKRGPTSLESAVRLWRSEKGRQKLPKLLRAQAKAEAAWTAAEEARQAGRPDEALRAETIMSAAFAEVESLRRELRASAATIKAKAKRARKAGRTRVAK